MKEVSRSEFGRARTISERLFFAFRGVAVRHQRKAIYRRTTEVLFHGFGVAQRPAAFPSAGRGASDGEHDLQRTACPPHVGGCGYRAGVGEERGRETGTQAV